MTKSYTRFVTALFCLFLGGMLVWSIVLPDRAKSEVENRSLAQWPKFSWSTLTSGEFGSGVEAYLADQFPLRDAWTGLKAHGEQILGKTEFHGVYLCGDTLISKVETPESGLPEKNLAYVQALAGKTDIPVYLGLIPTAAEVWSNKLPAGAESWDQSAYLAQAQTLGLPTIDFESALTAHTSENVYYRTDHHWTTLGAYYGYTAVLHALGCGNETIPEDNFSQETASEDFNGTLYSTSGIHWLRPDTMEFWVPDTNLTVTSWRTGKAESAALYDTSYLNKKDKYSAFLGGNQPLCVIENSSISDGGKLLIVRDSYSDSLAPFLAQNFSEVHLLDLRYYHASAAQYALDNDIDAIAVIYSVANFVTDQNLVFLAA